MCWGEIVLFHVICHWMLTLQPFSHQHTSYKSPWPVFFRAFKETACAQRFPLQTERNGEILGSSLGCRWKSSVHWLAADKCRLQESTWVPVNLLLLIFNNLIHHSMESCVTLQNLQYIETYTNAFRMHIGEMYSGTKCEFQCRDIVAASRSPGLPNTVIWVKVLTGEKGLWEVHSHINHFSCLQSSLCSLQIEFQSLLCVTLSLKVDLQLSVSRYWQRATRQGTFGTSH